MSKTSKSLSNAGTTGPDWATAPDWAKWWAVDEVGEANWYEDEPKLSVDCWFTRSGWFQFDREVSGEGWQHSKTNRKGVAKS